MRYECPTIVHREPLQGLLDAVPPSDKKNDTQQTSDVNVKENIVPVVWGDGTPYTGPAIVQRELLVAFLGDTVPSDKTNDGAVGISDRNIKHNVVPVDWSSAMRPYGAPAISHREPLQGLLDAVPPSDLKNDT